MISFLPRCHPTHFQAHHIIAESISWRITSLFANAKFAVLFELNSESINRMFTRGKQCHCQMCGQWPSFAQLSAINSGLAFFTWITRISWSICGVLADGVSRFLLKRKVPAWWLLCQPLSADVAFEWRAGSLDPVQPPSQRVHKATCCSLAALIRADRECGTAAAPSASGVPKTVPPCFYKQFFNSYLTFHWCMLLLTDVFYWHNFNYCHNFCNLHYCWRYVGSGQSHGAIGTKNIFE